MLSVNNTLVLSSSYFPIKILSWKDAVMLLFRGKAEVLATYDDELITISKNSTGAYGDFLNAYRQVGVTTNSPHALTLNEPAVIRLITHYSHSFNKAKFSRMNLFARDNFMCQYCGVSYSIANASKKLTYDHVVPKYKGGKLNWDNVVAACRPCNSKKANKSLQEAGLKLKKKPQQPSNIPIRINLNYYGKIPLHWDYYLSHYNFKHE